jgi:hypothetical protein
MDPDAYNNLCQTALDYLEQQEARVDQEFHLGQFNRMDYEQETGKMIFSDVGVVPRVVADYQIVGSLSGKSNTWLWAWDNPYLLENTVVASRTVRQFGQENKISQLTEPRWQASERDAREMTAIAAWLLKARGAYTFLSDDIRAYTIFTGIRWIGEKPPGDKVS